LINGKTRDKMSELKKDVKEMTDIWTERYRPTNFKDVIGQDEIVKRIEGFVTSKNLPHLLFAGPAGVGKSSLALLVVKKMYGNNWRENYLELNASDERGIDVIRQKVKNFARTRSLGDVSFKIIFLDEADALTKEAQQALRRTMENYSGTCRFVLSCNYSSKIIDPIQSRCAIFRFSLLNEKDIEKIVKNVAKNESLNVDESAINALYEISGGDCRRLINLLQASSSVGKKIDAELIYKIVSVVKPKDIRKILELSIEGKFVDARELLLNVMLKQSVSGLDIIKEMSREIWKLDIKDEEKVKLIEKCGEIEFRLTEGSDEFVQLEALLASFLLIGRGK
jgi:replication factor C small subunit